MLVALTCLVAGLISNLNPALMKAVTGAILECFRYLIVKTKYSTGKYHVCSVHTICLYEAHCQRNLEEVSIALSQRLVYCSMIGTD